MALIRLVIADDHELIREGVKKIVRHCADLKVVGEAGDLQQAIALVAQVRPDVVVLDVSLPDYDGLDGLVELRRHFPALRVVMLSMHPEERYALAALRAGAFGYVSKNTATAELVQALRQAATGAPWIGPRVAELLAREAVCTLVVPRSTLTVWLNAADGLTFQRSWAAPCTVMPESCSPVALSPWK